MELIQSYASKEETLAGRKHFAREIIKAAEENSFQYYICHHELIEGPPREFLFDEFRKFADLPSMRIRPEWKQDKFKTLESFLLVAQMYRYIKLVIKYVSEEPSEQQYLSPRAYLDLDLTRAVAVARKVLQEINMSPIHLGHLILTAEAYLAAKADPSQNGGPLKLLSGTGIDQATFNEFVEEEQARTKRSKK